MTYREIFVKYFQETGPAESAARMEQLFVEFETTKPERIADLAQEIDERDALKILDNMKAARLGKRELFFELSSAHLRTYL